VGRARGSATRVNGAFERLEDVVLDELFPEVDLQLRRGRHVGREDGPAYAFLADAHDHLELFYRRFGAELVHKSDGYFYLLPSSDRLGRAQLNAGEMLVGQALALMYLDPDSLLHGGVVSREPVLQRLASLVGQHDLVQVLHRRLRKADERVAAEVIRTRFARALRTLADLGFVDLVADDKLHLRPALMRFAEPVRSAGDPVQTLALLVARGELELATDGEETQDEAEEAGDA
jgi:chromosome partition protein MukE